MEITFKGAQYDLPERVTARATTKLLSVKKVLGKKRGLAHAYVELGKTAPHQSGDVWCASVRLEVDGKLFVAKAVADTIETAIDRMVDEVTMEIKKYKQRDKSLVIKGGQAFKNLIRGFGSA